MSDPSRICILLVTSRVGSSLLCDWLNKTGMFDACGEWMVSRYPQEWPNQFAEATKRHKRIVIKCTGWHIQTLIAHFGLEQMRSYKYAHLYREDKFAQAVSHYRAIVSNRWRAIPGETEADVPFDRERIAEEYRRIILVNNVLIPEAMHRITWQHEPLHTCMPSFSYEYMCQRPGHVVQQMCWHVLGSLPNQVNLNTSYEIQRNEKQLKEWRLLMGDTYAELLSDPVGSALRDVQTRDAPIGETPDLGPKASDVPTEDAPAQSLPSQGWLRTSLQ